MKPIIIFLPENLNLEGILKENPPKFKYHVDEFKYIVGTITYLKTKHKDYLERDYIPLNAKILQSKIRAYNRCLSYLIEKGIIETDNRFILGEKCRGYKLALKYAEREYRIEDITKRSLIRKRGDQLVQDKKFIKNYEFLAKWFNESLKIDRDGAINRLEALKHDEAQKGKKGSEERYFLRLATVDQINKENFHLNVDGTSKRFHSNLTNLKSSLRNYITYNGQQLCSIDIKNSQPFISSILFKKEFYDKDHKGLSLYSLSKEIYEKTKCGFGGILEELEEISNIITLVKPDKTQCSSDLELYLTLIDKGRLYPFMSDAYYKKSGIKLDVGIKEERDQIKKSIFLSFYSHNKYFYQENAEMKRLFADIFPTVYKIFSLLKVKQYELLAVILQLVESEIVINRVAKRISREYPELPIFTIHDSIVTLVEYSGMVGGIIKMEFERSIGLLPSLAYESWQIPNEE
jgi:hypothetical protein